MYDKFDHNRLKIISFEQAFNHFKAGQCKTLCTKLDAFNLNAHAGLITILHLSTYYRRFTAITVRNAEGIKLTTFTLKALLTRGLDRCSRVRWEMSTSQNCQVWLPRVYNSTIGVWQHLAMPHKARVDQPLRVQFYSPLQHSKSNVKPAQNCCTGTCPTLHTTFILHPSNNQPLPHKHPASTHRENKSSLTLAHQFQDCADDDY